MCDAAETVLGTQETNLPDVMKTLKLPILHSFTVIDHAVAGSVRFVFRGNSQGGFRCDSSSSGLKFITLCVSQCESSRRSGCVKSY